MIPLGLMNQKLAPGIEELSGPSALVPPVTRADVLPRGRASVHLVARSAIARYLINYTLGYLSTQI
jgi:hypothetical protein